MSDSRLEKFIYAICSMDVSDLPVPLSRIEKLWNCLITGETPDFEPLSRNEKYLMAMLDRYDISNLPAPMSRGEKLLYKIAVGETDLSDVPGYLSRYEELLKYLIENGGISGGDFEYVLYTLNQSLSTLYSTAEKPVKSAILKGNTLVNLIDNGSERKEITYSRETKANYRINKDMLVANKTYLLLFTVTDFSGDAFHVSFNKSDQYGITRLTDIGNGLFKAKVNFSDLTSVTDTLIIYKLRGTALGGYVEKVMLIEYQEGMENWDIPYFDGMQSVKMPVLTTTGKNLINMNDYALTDGVSITQQNENSITFNAPYKWGGLQYRMQLNPNTKYTVSMDRGENTIVQLYVRLKNENGNYSGAFGGGNKYSFTTNNTGFVFITIETSLTNQTNLHISNLQLEEGSTATPYEPYKSNILTVNEDIELRGIGEVKDELNLPTGELTQRIGEFIVDESRTYAYESSNQLFYTPLHEMKKVNDFEFSILSENAKILKNHSYMDVNYSYNGISITGYADWANKYPNQNWLYLKINNITTVSDLKQYLSENPITVQYQLATESVKTVDLTTVDQDGQPTKLKTYNDVTHVEINADNIIPSVDLEVATKINKTLSTMGLQHHDISNTQNKLGQTIKEQTENTDATMMATTEIYEQTL